MDDPAIAFDVRALHVLQETATTPDHLQQTTTTVVILLVITEVIVEIVDSLGEDGDLYASGSGVLLRSAVLLNGCGFVESHASD